VLYDTSTLEDSTATAGGTVDYYVSDVDGCDPEDEATDHLGQKTVTDAVVPDSDTYAIPGAGTYYFWADYSGDAKNAAAVSPCDSEIVIVVLNEPTIGTQVWNTNGALADSEIADDGEVAIGTVAYDTSELTDETASAGGTVDYYVKAQVGHPDDEDYVADCDTDGATHLGQKTVTNGIVPNSNNTAAFDTAGTYEFWADYSGDDNNVATISPCGSETIIVVPNEPTFDTQPSVQIRDSFELSGLTSDATGAVTVELFDPTDATCDLEPAFSAVATIGTDGTFASGTFSFTTEYTDANIDGTWRWRVSYDGDANNAAALSACGVESVVVDITPNHP
jgi:hypothetical protein